MPRTVDGRLVETDQPGPTWIQYLILGAGAGMWGHVAGAGPDVSILQSCSGLGWAGLGWAGLGWLTPAKTINMLQPPDPGNLCPAPYSHSRAPH